MAHFFKRQPLHFALLALLLLVVWALGGAGEAEGPGFLGIGTEAWFRAALIVPVLHQVYVWLAWRGELCFSAVTKILGPGGFRPYAVLFSIFMLLRILIFLGLAISDRGSYPLPGLAAIPLAAVCLALSAYAFYSVARYFTFRRAFGIDHFDPACRSAPLVREGIFRYTRNGMYTFAFLIFWAIALLFASRAALVASLFAHAYVWVHYFCTEKPDMEVIYGGGESGAVIPPAPGCG